MMLKKNERFFGKFKQGQTVYCVSFNFRLDESRDKFVAELDKWFLHSHKTELAKNGERVVNMNESYINKVIKLHRDCGAPVFVTTSRRKALKKKREVERRVN